MGRQGTVGQRCSFMSCIRSQGGEHRFPSLPWALDDLPRHSRHKSTNFGCSRSELSNHFRLYYKGYKSPSLSYIPLVATAPRTAVSHEICAASFSAVGGCQRTCPINTALTFTKQVNWKMVITVVWGLHMERNWCSVRDVTEPLLVNFYMSYTWWHTMLETDSSRQDGAGIGFKKLLIGTATSEKCYTTNKWLYIW